jgi:hypothetical protein
MTVAKFKPRHPSQQYFQKKKKHLENIVARDGISKKILILHNFESSRFPYWSLNKYGDLSRTLPLVVTPMIYIYKIHNFNYSSI